MTINCIIIEDEPLATEKLSDFIRQYSDLALIASFDKALDAISFLKQNQVDLIFLDIQMKGFDGIQFLEAISPRPYVIITSAYSQYALKCYEFSVDDYLLKPYSFERFIKSVEKIANKISVEKAQNVVEKDSIFVNTEYRLERIELNQILYIEGMKDYLKIVTPDKKIMTLQSFKKIQKILPSRNFIRTHKSFIVALNKIECIERNRIKIRDMVIPISDRYKKDFFKAIQDLSE